MLRIVLLCFIVAIVFPMCAEDSFEIKETDIPKNVMDAFRAKYPSVKVNKWEAEKDNGTFYFGAEFTDGGKKMEVHITADGSSVTEEK